MFRRLCKLDTEHSFFLFGARGTGKTHLVSEVFSQIKPITIDLLLPETEARYQEKPDLLIEEAAKWKPGQWVFIDEVQKLPKLLDVVHHLIEKKGIRFALTGSSARKLKLGSANLLQDRAFVYNLYPLTHRELGAEFDLMKYCTWGGLPKIASLSTDENKADFLRAYAHVYLKEEILIEQLVRQVEPFRAFLHVAAQLETQILNFSKIARDVGADPKTVKEYYSILEDTWIGFLLQPYHASVRKRQNKNPKFYFFDLGVRQALEKSLTVKLSPANFGFGRIFESFVINEIRRLNDYGKKDYTLSYLRTKDDAEIDLVIERPGLPMALLEIKSSEKADETDIRKLERFRADFPQAQMIFASRDPIKRKVGSIEVLPWEQAILELGL